MILHQEWTEESGKSKQDGKSKAQIFPDTISSDELIFLVLTKAASASQHNGCVL